MPGKLSNPSKPPGTPGPPTSSGSSKPAKPSKLAQRNPFSSFVSTALPGEELANARRLPLELIDINPRQARQQFDEEALEELAASIREHDVMQPIGVMRKGDRYQIIFGERRYRAANMAEKTDIPVVIYEDLSEADAAIMTALENLQREDLDLEDEARQFDYLLELTGMSQRKLAQALGINHVYLSRRVKLLKRPDLLKAYSAGRMNLHEVVAKVDQPPEVMPGTQSGPSVSDTGGEEASDQTVSPGNSEGVSEELVEPDPELVLVEREDLSGFIVSRGNSLATDPTTATARSTRFRWRPAMHFRNWLTRTKPEEIPDDERASFMAQIVEIRAALDEWETNLANWQQSSEQETEKYGAQDVFEDRDGNRDGKQNMHADDEEERS